MLEHPPSSRTRCLLCLVLRLCMVLAITVPMAAHGAAGEIWKAVAWALALGAPLVWAHWRWCPDRAWLKATRRLRWHDDTLHVAQVPDESHLSSLFCGKTRLRWNALPVDDIAALRLTPGYLAIYLKPSLAAVDVFFEKHETEAVQALLAPLAHLFVDEAPK